MKVFRNFEDARQIRNPVVTTGSFDGVHLAHKTIINRLRMLAEKNDGESVLITFHPHPRKVLYPDTAGKDLKLINSQEEKLELLRLAGLDNIIIIEFTKDFAKTTSEKFVKDFLVSILNVKVVVVGFNHHFGFNKAGDYRQLWEMGARLNFITEEIPEQEVQHETVSSTLIRQAVSEGFIQRANAYLDHYYMIMGTPQLYESDFLPDSISFYRIPVTEDTKLLPVSGIYASSFGHGNEYSRGMVVIFKDNSGNTEVLLHSLNEEVMVAGKKTIINFHKRVSDEIHPGNTNLIYRSLKMAITEIAELIY